ncbi:AAA family ATPase [Vagococcus sp. JNUCC 83]
MGSYLNCQLFGTPEVSLNGEIVLFSFSKINAMLYYLLINKTVSRDELSGLLWPDKSDKNAKKNLRNAIYQANKSLDMELIISPNKSLLMLNDSINLTSDVEQFTQDPETYYYLYKGEFLKGFYLKDCEGFDFWVVRMKSFFEKKFVETVHRRIEKDIAEGVNEHVEEAIEQLMFIDEFNEINYQYLMTFYQQQGRDNKVVDVYHKLSNLLKSELGVTPNKQTKSIYEVSLDRIVSENTTQNQRFSSLFYGRSEELQQLSVNFAAFKSGQPYQSFVVRGEAGIGKSALINRAIDSVSSDFKIIETQCYQAEEKHLLRPWKKIIDQLSDVIEEQDVIDPEVWQKVIRKVFPNFTQPFLDVISHGETEPYKEKMLSDLMIEAINKLSQQQQLIFLFDDIQWMDESSLELLTTVMLHCHTNAMFLISARSVERYPLDKFINTLKQSGKLSVINLEPFSYEETDGFIRKKLPQFEVTTTIVDNVYQHTEGNLFFLIEYVSLLNSNTNLNTMTVKMKDALRNRFLYLTEEEQELVSIISYFYDYALIDSLVFLINKSSYDIVAMIENLVSKNILVEKAVGDKIATSFTHVKLREFVYMNQSLAKKRVLHHKIAEFLETQLKPGGNDILQYDTIAYHYKHGKDELKGLKYRLKYFEGYLGFYHELFPVEGQYGIDPFSFNKDWASEQFEKINQRLLQLNDDEKQTELYHLLQLQYLYLEGRFLIKYGEYERGVANIQSVLLRAKESNDHAYLLNGYKQMIYYYIQINEPKEMIYYIELALDLSIKENNHQSIGILLRLKGLYHMMSGNNTIAEKLLKESINTFMLTEEISKKYSVSIAAAYNYLGEIKLNDGEYQDAVLMFEKAIDLCQSNQALSSLTIFYINVGVALFALGNINEAEIYFLKAEEIFSSLNFYWKRAKLDAYLSILYAHKKHSQKSQFYLSQASKHAKRMGNCRDIGMVEYAKYINYHVYHNDDIDNVLEKEGIYKYLNDYQDAYELDQLKII